MAKLSKSGSNGKKRNGIKLQLKSLFAGKNNVDNNNNEENNIVYGSYENYEDSRSSSVPEDVKEGHFAVVAVGEEEARRFVVPLRYLRHPRFQKLLEQSAEEFGFNQEGTLAMPCSPMEIERILADQKWHQPSSRVGVNTNYSWESCNTNNSMVQIC